MPSCDLRPRLLLGLVLIAGCGRVHLGDHDSGIVVLDAGPPSDGGGIVVCGPSICPAGTVCCNDSCGICTGPGEACPAIECVPGCTSDADCETGNYCAWPVGACGPSMPEVGTCTPLAEVCPPVIHEVCGCDGLTYTSPCDAQAVGVSIFTDGPCTITPCSPQDAVGEGLCPGLLGVAWDGERCQLVGGCSCVGADCGALFETTEECARAHASCTSCAPQDAYGEGLCDLFLGWVWNGMTCSGISGCSCVGADCGSTYSELEACNAAHELCLGGCFDSSECGPGEFCQFDWGTCGGPGACVAIPPELMCTFEALPVCGCDGVTYGCEENAYQVGVSVAYEGACASGTECGTIAGFTCQPDEWCDYPEPSWCGGDDSGGRCIPRPTACPDNIDPVCGCDGTVYNNACEAHAAGYDSWSDPTMCGAPPPGP